MSHYRKIVTTLVKGSTLVEALRALNLNPQVSPDLVSPTLSLQNGYDRAQPVAILVGEAAVKQSGMIPSGFSNSLFGSGFGYRWDPEAGAYGLVQDGMDAGKLQATHDRIAQRYGVINATQAAWEQGYSVAESQASDGTIELVLVRSY